MEAMLAPTVSVLLIVGAGLFSSRWLRDAVEVSRTRVIRMSPNSNEEAERIFLELLREAQNEIVMYDDGDTGEGSLYQSETVVQEIKAKLRKNPGFKVDCLLNHRTGSTLFEKELDQVTSGVRIRQRRDDPSRIHYKIIDGRKAYVSCHRQGQAARNRTMIDCTNALPRRRKGRPLALRRYFDDFERHVA